MATQGSQKAGSTTSPAKAKEPSEFEALFDGHTAAEFAYHDVDASRLSLPFLFKRRG